MSGTGVDLKQEIMRINNIINIGMFGTGLRKQRVVLVEDMVIISADHKRIPALASLDAKYRDITRNVDAAILNEYKERLKAELMAQLQLRVKCVLKDYDPGQEMALTVVILDEAACKKCCEKFG